MIALASIGVWQIILIVMILIVSILPIVALIDIIQNEFTGSNKLIWVLVVLFLPMFGSIMYFFMGKDQRLKR
ncbi:PLD nuclease N-terminal domain-containing protein [Aequorivita vitellina]